jgi:hypothetical protein
MDPSRSPQIWRRPGLAGALTSIATGSRPRRMSTDSPASTRRSRRESWLVGGIEVAGVGDILAMKLKVIVDRGELRDYFDLMAIERDAGRTVEEGLGLSLERYGLELEPFVIEPVVRARKLLVQRRGYGVTSV